MPKPTPTQEENDRAALGEHILEHEHDGSEVQETLAPPAGAGTPEQRKRLEEQHKKQMEAKPAGGYQTRAATPKPSSGSGSTLP